MGPRRWLARAPLGGVLKGRPVEICEGPELVIREGDPGAEILTLVREDPSIGVLVLGAGTDKSGPGPLVTLMTKSAGTLPIPVTIVPGEMSKERLEAIT